MYVLIYNIVCYFCIEIKINIIRDGVYILIYICLNWNFDLNVDLEVFLKFGIICLEL